MTRERAEPLRLDYLIKAGAIHAMTGDTYRSVGLRGPEIAAVSTEPDGLDDLAGRDTVEADLRDLTVLPAFSDAHEHLMEASRNTLLVPVDRARSLSEFLGMIGDAARNAPPGRWIITSMDWHESNLAENRLPTGAELDAAAPGHPVFARRGGHLAIVNTLALQAAGVDASTRDPRGGRIDRLPDGRPSGRLEDRAVCQVAAFAPALPADELGDALGTGSAAYAALGVGTIREAMVTLDDLLAYQHAWRGGLLPWTLVIEHALLSDPDQRQRAVRGGFGVTVQHSLLWNMGSEMLVAWGPDRTRRVSPLDEWLAAGASLAAGTDIARPFNPMTNVWGMATRGTKSAGIQGPEHAIDVPTALRLYTTGSADLNGEAHRLGSITPGKLADLVAYPIDPLTADVDDLADLRPALTMVGGRATHDPDKRLAR